MNYFYNLPRELQLEIILHKKEIEQKERMPLLLKQLKEKVVECDAVSIEGFCEWHINGTECQRAGKRYNSGIIYHPDSCGRSSQLTTYWLRKKYSILTQHLDSSHRQDRQRYTHACTSGYYPVRNMKGECVGYARIPNDRRPHDHKVKCNTSPYKFFKEKIDIYSYIHISLFQ